MNEKPNAAKVVILLHTAGPEAQEVFNQFEFRPAGPANVPPAEDRDNWETVLDKFRHYCKPRKNTEVLFLSNSSCTYLVFQVPIRKNKQYVLLHKV